MAACAGPKRMGLEPIRSAKSIAPVAGQWVGHLPLSPTSNPRTGLPTREWRTRASRQHLLRFAPEPSMSSAGQWKLLMSTTSREDALRVNANCFPSGDQS